MIGNLGELLSLHPISYDYKLVQLIRLDKTSSSLSFKANRLFGDVFILKAKVTHAVGYRL